MEPPGLLLAGADAAAGNERGDVSRGAAAGARERGGVFRTVGMTLGRTANSYSEFRPVFFYKVGRYVTPKETLKVCISKGEMMGHSSKI